MKYKNWKTIFLNNIQTFIYDLQYKIYGHSKTNEIGLVRHYQHKSVKSEEARILAV
jgi:hypothetical protein